MQRLRDIQIAAHQAPGACRAGPSRHHRPLPYLLRAAHPRAACFSWWVRPGVARLPADRLLRPLAAIVRSGRAASVYCSAALDAIRTLFEDGVIGAWRGAAAAGPRISSPPALGPGPLSLRAQEGISLVVDAMSHCRFEATDPVEDDLCLCRVVETLQACFCGPCGRLLADEAVWTILQMCLRVFFEARSPRLEHACRTATVGVVTVLAERALRDAAPPAARTPAPATAQDVPLCHGLPSVVRALAALAVVASSCPCPVDDNGATVPDNEDGEGDSGDQDTASESTGVGMGAGAEEQGCDSLSTPAASPPAPAVMIGGATPRRGSAVGPALMLGIVPDEMRQAGFGSPGAPRSATTTATAAAAAAPSLHPPDRSLWATLSAHREWHPGLHELSLAALAAALRRGGRALGALPPLLHLVRDDVCYALLRTAHSPRATPAAVTHALQCAHAIIACLGGLLPNETGALLRHLFLRPLRNPFPGVDGHASADADAAAIDLPLIDAVMAGAGRDPLGRDKGSTRGDTGPPSPHAALRAALSLAVQVPSPPARAQYGDGSARAGVATLLTQEGSDAALRCLADMLSDPKVVACLFRQHDLHSTREPLLARLVATLAFAAAPRTCRAVALRECWADVRAAAEEAAGPAEGAGSDPDAPPLLLAGPVPWAQQSQAQLAASAIASVMYGVRAAAQRARRGHAGRARAASGDAGAVEHRDSGSVGSNGHRGDSSAVAARRAKKRAVAHAVRHFGAKPTRGVWALEAAGVLPPGADPEAVAWFLRGGCWGLRKEAVGAFLGDDGPLANRVLPAFVQTFDFRGLGVVEALREYLEVFRLPGEAQVIDRLVEAFAGHLFAQGRDAECFDNADVAFLLSFSTIMLNTDLHNPSMDPRRRMRRRQFVRYNTIYGPDVRQRRPLPASLLRGIYDDIRAREIRTSNDPTQPAVSPQPAAATHEEPALRTWRHAAERVQGVSSNGSRALGASAGASPPGSAPQPCWLAPDDAYTVWGDPRACITAEAWAETLRASSRTGTAVTLRKRIERRDGPHDVATEAATTAAAAAPPSPKHGGQSGSGGEEKGDGANLEVSTDMTPAPEADADAVLDSDEVGALMHSVGWVALLGLLGAADAAPVDGVGSRLLATALRATQALGEASAEAGTRSLSRTVLGALARRTTLMGASPAVPRHTVPISDHAHTALLQRLVHFGVDSRARASTATLFLLARHAAPTLPHGAWDTLLAIVSALHDARLLAPRATCSEPDDDVLAPAYRRRLMRALYADLASAPADPAPTKAAGSLLSWLFGGEETAADAPPQQTAQGGGGDRGPDTDRGTELPVEDSDSDSDTESDAGSASEATGGPAPNGSGDEHKGHRGKGAPPAALGSGHRAASLAAMEEAAPDLPLTSLGLLKAVEARHAGHVAPLHATATRDGVVVAAADTGARLGGLARVDAAEVLSYATARHASPSAPALQLARGPVADSLRVAGSDARAVERAVASVAACDLPALLHETRRVPAATVRHLAATLADAASTGRARQARGEPGRHGTHPPAPFLLSARSALFALHLAEELVWANEARAHEVWGPMHALFCSLLGAGGQVSLLSERAVTSLFRLARRLLLHPRAAPAVARTLEDAYLALPGPTKTLFARHAAGGLVPVLRRAPRHATDAAAWDTLLATATASVDRQKARRAFGAALLCAARDPEALAAMPSAALAAFASSVIAHPRASVEEALRAVALLYRRQQAFLRVGPDAEAQSQVPPSSAPASDVPAGSEDGVKAVAWLELLQPLVQCSGDARDVVRFFALVTARQALLSPPEDALTPTQWVDALRRVSAPALRQALERPPRRPVALASTPYPRVEASPELDEAVAAARECQRDHGWAVQRTRLVAASALSKAFLRRLRPLSVSPSFSDVWQDVLVLINLAASAAPPPGLLIRPEHEALLSEAATQMSRNLVQVMTAAGLLAQRRVPGGEEAESESPASDAMRRGTGATPPLSAAKEDHDGDSEVGGREGSGEAGDAVEAGQGVDET